MSFNTVKYANQLLAENERLKQQVQQLDAEAAMMKQIIDAVTDLDNEPQYHDEGMGCGLEDRGITDRYEAMRHGWDEAMEGIYGEVIPCAEELSFEATDARLNEVRAQGLDMLASQLNGYAENHVYSHTKRHAEDFAAKLRAGEVKTNG